MIPHLGDLGAVRSQLAVSGVVRLNTSKNRKRLMQKLVTWKKRVKV